MEVSTLLGVRAIKALVNLGSTYNFISQRIVAEQKMEVVKDAPLIRVLNASSYQLRVYNYYKAIVTTQDETS